MKIIAFILCLSCVTMVAAETVRIATFYCGSKDEGQTGLFFEIPVKRARELPTWSPESTNAPPVSMSSACATAKKAMQARYATTNDFEIRGIHLCSLASLDTWYYDIECQTTKFDRWWAPCGMRAIILMDGETVEPRIEGRASDLSEVTREANRVSFDIEQQFARARMGDTNALTALFDFSPKVDAAKSAGFGKLMIELLGELGDASFSKLIAFQSSESRTAIRSHLDVGVANTKSTRLQRPIAKAFPLTYAALTSQ